MTSACRCFRFWLDDDEALPPDPVAAAERARHLHECEVCRQALEICVTQRAGVRDVYRTNGPPPALSEALVRRCLNAMNRAADAAAPPDDPEAGRPAA